MQFSTNLMNTSTYIDPILVGLTDLNGKRQGIWQSIDPFTNKLLFQFSYKNSIFQGLFKSYNIHTINENEIQLIYSKFFNNDIPEGEVIYFYF